VATMSKASSRTLDQPDEQVEKGGVTIDVVYLGDIKVKRANYPAGWKFSEKMGADRCGDTHVGYVIEGSMQVRMDDGTEISTNAGDVFMVPAGHDAWSDEGCTIVQFDEFDSAASRFGVS
jgi:ethanolamine utilization protein EutQ (cupin superfamily)